MKHALSVAHMTESHTVYFSGNLCKCVFVLLIVLIQTHLEDKRSNISFSSPFFPFSGSHSA